jgi:X-X-X-Leu-X-X-Gly heptad repeat protein
MRLLAFRTALCAVVLCLAGAVPARANLVQNGSFEINGGVGELAGGITTLANWTVGATVDGAPYPFDFVIDKNADSTGFPSVFSPPNITI